MNSIASIALVAARQFLPLSAAVVVGLSMALSAGAQDPPQFEELPLFKKDNKEIANWSSLNTFMLEDKKAVEGMLGGAAMDQAKFEKFFNEVFFPMFTARKTYADRTAFPAKMRQSFKKDFVARATNASARDKLIEVTLAKMQQVANGNFHPWARANAAIMIEELNDGEPGPPSKKAYPVLFKWATDPAAPDVVRIPALRGLERHAAVPNAISAEERPKVVAAMLVIAKQHTATEEQSLAGHEWILRRAIDILATLGEPGDKGAVCDEMVKLVDDEAAPRPARATAAAALAKIRFTPPKDFDAEGVAKSLGKFAVAAYKAELAEATPFRKPISVGRLKQQLSEVRKGLAGPTLTAMLTTDAQKKFAADIVAQIDALLKACDTEPGIFDAVKAQTDPNFVPGVPFDAQEPIAKAISTAGGALEAVLQAGVGGAVAPPADAIPGGVPGAEPPPGVGPVKPMQVIAPKGPARPFE